MTFEQLLAQSGMTAQEFVAAMAMMKAILASGMTLNEFQSLIAYGKGLVTRESLLARAAGMREAAAAAAIKAEQEAQQIDALAAAANVALRDL
jgi:hypothetical protein